MIEVRNNGVPLVEQAPKAPITQAIIGLAKAISGDEAGGGRGGGGREEVVAAALLGL